MSGLFWFYLFLEPPNPFAVVHGKHLANHLSRVVCLTTSLQLFCFHPNEIIAVKTYYWISIQYGKIFAKEWTSQTGKQQKGATWMSQEVCKRLGSVGYNPNIPHLEGYNPLIRSPLIRSLPGPGTSLRSSYYWLTGLTPWCEQTTNQSSNIRDPILLGGSSQLVSG